MTMLMEARDIVKSFSGVRALDRIGMTVGRGEVHALLGENGAGKSTFLKILAGAQAADAGELVVDGKPLGPADTPLDRQRAGVVTIYQEFNLLPEMSIAENMYLGREPRRFRLIDWPRMFADAAIVLRDLGLDLDPRTPVRRLSVAQQQMVEIARAMTFSAKLIIMDEPTAALSSREVEVLYGIVRDLRSRGLSIIYVTHRLTEVLALCDRYTVFRDGRFIADGNVSGLDTTDLVRLMVGRDIEFVRRQYSGKRGNLVLRVENVSREASVTDPHATILRNMSVDVHAGEILGFAGLVGAGRTELARIIFGADGCDDGVVWLGERRLEIFRSPQEAIRNGIALVPEDRKEQGCFLDQSVKQNMTLPSLKRLSRWGVFIDEPAETALFEKYRRALRIKMPDAAMSIGKLSGGNQQKVLLARCIALAPKLLIVDEPTRGIDVGAKAEVHQVLVEMAQQGVAVIVISSELPEIMAISDRVVVFREGCINGVVDGASATEEALMALMAVGPRDTARPMTAAA